MLWPTPLTENKQPKYSYHGYAATDTYRIDPRFGTQRGLPPHGGRRARQGHRRDPGRGAQPHRLRALVDARHARARLDRLRRQVRADAARAHHRERPVRVARGREDLHRRLVRPEHARHEPAQSVPGHVPDPERDLVDRVRRPVGPARGHLGLFRPGLPAGVDAPRDGRVSEPQHRRRGVDEPADRADALAGRRARRRTAWRRRCPARWTSR